MMMIVDIAGHAKKQFGDVADELERLGEDMDVCEAQREDVLTRCIDYSSYRWQCTDFGKRAL